jgi:hypothetical protein
LTRFLRGYRTSAAYHQRIHDAFCAIAGLCTERSYGLKDRHFDFQDLPPDLLEATPYIVSNGARCGTSL